MHANCEVEISIEDVTVFGEMAYKRTVQEPNVDT